MSLSSRTKAATLTVLLIVASSAAGFVLGAWAQKAVAKKKDDPNFWKSVAMRQIDRLEPTEEQRGKFEARVDAAVQDLIAIRKETIAKAEATVIQAAHDIAADLSPEQREIFEKIRPKSSSPTSNSAPAPRAGPDTQGMQDSEGHEGQSPKSEQ